MNIPTHVKVRPELHGRRAPRQAPEVSCIGSPAPSLAEGGTKKWEPQPDLPCTFLEVSFIFGDI